MNPLYGFLGQRRLDSLVPKDLAAGRVDAQQVQRQVFFLALALRPGRSRCTQVTKILSPTRYRAGGPEPGHGRLPDDVLGRATRSSAAPCPPTTPVPPGPQELRPIGPAEQGGAKRCNDQRRIRTDSIRGGLSHGVALAWARSKKTRSKKNRAGLPRATPPTACQCELVSVAERSQIVGCVLARTGLSGKTRFVRASTHPTRCFRNRNELYPEELRPVQRPRPFRAGPARSRIWVSTLLRLGAAVQPGRPQGGRYSAEKCRTPVQCSAEQHSWFRPAGLPGVHPVRPSQWV